MVRVNRDDNYKQYQINENQVITNDMTRLYNVDNNHNEGMTNDKDLVKKMLVSSIFSLPLREDREEFSVCLDDRKIKKIMSYFDLLLKQSDANSRLQSICKEEKMAMMSWPQWLINGQFNHDLFQSFQALFCLQHHSLTPDIIVKIRTMEDLQENGEFNVKLFKYMCIKYLQEKIESRSENTLQTVQEGACCLSQNDKDWPEWKINGEFNERFYKHVYMLLNAQHETVTQVIVKSIREMPCYISSVGLFKLNEFCLDSTYTAVGLDKIKNNHRVREYTDDEKRKWSVFFIDNKFSQQLFDSVHVLFNALEEELNEHHIAYYLYWEIFNFTGKFDLDLFCDWSFACEKNLNRIQSGFNCCELLNDLFEDKYGGENEMSFESMSETDELPAPLDEDSELPSENL